MLDCPIGMVCVSETSFHLGLPVIIIFFFLAGMILGFLANK